MTRCELCGRKAICGECEQKVRADERATCLRAVEFGFRGLHGGGNARRLLVHTIELLKGEALPNQPTDAV